MAALLEAAGLGRRYGWGRWAHWGLRDCSFSVPAGRVVGLVGLNGAGKSTLLRMAAGLVRPTEGTITVAGIPAHRPEALSRLAFVGQNKPLYQGLTAAETLRYGAATNPGFDRRGTEKWLVERGIPLTTRVGRLSGGQRAQVALALALGKRADVVLLDEPLANLDPLARESLLRELMAGVADRDSTLLLSSHVIAELTEVCDSLLLVNGGRLQVAGQIDDLIAGHRLLVGPVEAYTGGVRVGPHPVVAATTTARQATVLIRLTGRFIDPRWTVNDVSLDDLVLAYLRRPGETWLPPGPRLEVAA